MADNPAPPNPAAERLRQRLAQAQQGDASIDPKTLAALAELRQARSVLAPSSTAPVITALLGSQALLAPSPPVTSPPAMLPDDDAFKMPLLSALLKELGV